MRAKRRIRFNRRMAVLWGAYAVAAAAGAALRIDWRAGAIALLAAVGGFVACRHMDNAQAIDLDGPCIACAGGDTVAVKCSGADELALLIWACAQSAKAAGIDAEDAQRIVEMAYKTEEMCDGE